MSTQPAIRHPEDFKEQLKSIDWGDPIPFDESATLPSFPVAALPSKGREIVREISAVAQVDPGMTGALYLATLSACLRGRVAVDLLSHQEPINLYIAAQAEPGERKSQVVSILTNPVLDFQAKKRTDMGEAIRDAINSLKILETRLAGLQRKAATSDDALVRMEFTREAAQVSKQIEESPIPVWPTIIADDITNEKLGDLMAENGECLSIISAEGGIFRIANGLYSSGEGNIDLYLKAHAGDFWASHRIGRKSINMKRPALTMGLAIQHDVIEEIGRNKHFRGRGLLARFLYVICKPQAGQRTRQTQTLSETILSAYQDQVVGLLEDDRDSVLQLADDAHLVWNVFYNETERDMRPGGCLAEIKDWTSKLPGAVARIAGILHLAEHGPVGKEIPVSAATVAAACAIGIFFREHALQTFQAMGEDSRIVSAKKILSYIERVKPTQFKGRDVLRHVFFATRSMDDVNPGLDILIERNFVRATETQYSGKGRPAATVYEVNPNIF